MQTSDTKMSLDCSRRTPTSISKVRSSVVSLPTCRPGRRIKKKLFRSLSLLNKEIGTSGSIDLKITFTIQYSRSEEAKNLVSQTS